MILHVPPKNDELPSQVECRWLPLPIPDRDELAMLRAAGATEFALREVRAFPVDFARDGFFDLARLPGDDTRAFIVPVRDMWEAVIDLAAWRPHDPRAIGLMTGAAAMLGEGQVENPASFAVGATLSVFRTATRWLANDCRGIVIVDHRRAALRLTDAQRLRGEDADHARELGHLLAPHVPAERIFAPRTIGRAA